MRTQVFCASAFYIIKIPYLYTSPFFDVFPSYFCLPYCCSMVDTVYQI